jgi:organic radical activating enzyme
MTQSLPNQAAAELSGTIELSETFSSIQGEGASAGEPCLFVRLALCNLRCSWCDTKYTWDFRTHRYEDEVQTRSLESILAEILRAPERRVVITGGEPLVQQRALVPLLQRVPRGIVIEVETNGTLLPDAVLLERVDQWNVSPKLANAGEAERRRVHLDVLRTLAQTGRAYLKLVLEGPEDLAEAEALVTAAEWPKNRVLLMPRASTRAEYERVAPQVAALCAAPEYRFSPRLHVVQWDGARGR